MPQALQPNRFHAFATTNTLLPLHHEQTSRNDQLRLCSPCRRGPGGVRRRARPRRTCPPVVRHVGPLLHTQIHIHSSHTNRTEPRKLSKSQLKKLQKHARTERRKQAKAATKTATAESSPRATPSLEQSIAHSVVVSDEEDLSSEAENAPPGSSIETDEKDVPLAPEPPRPRSELNSDVSTAIKLDSTCMLFCGVSVLLIAHS